MYSKPELKRFGSFRALTQWCWLPWRECGDDGGFHTDGGSEGSYGRTGS